MYDMGKTLTVRTSDKLEKALRDRADEAGLSLSELVREILESAVAERPLGERIAHLMRPLEPSSRPLTDWQRQLRERNWRE